MFAQPLSVAVGLWVYASPAVLGYDGRAADVAYVAGPIAAAIAFLAVFDLLRALRYVNVAVGVSLAGSAAVAVTAIVAVNAVLSGVALVGLSFVRGTRRHDYGGGWRAIFR